MFLKGHALHTATTSNTMPRQFLSVSINVNPYVRKTDKQPLAKPKTQVNKQASNLCSLKVRYVKVTETTCANPASTHVWITLVEDSHMIADTNGKISQAEINWKEELTWRPPREGANSKPELAIRRDSANCRKCFRESSQEPVFGAERARYRGLCYPHALPFIPFSPHISRSTVK